MRKNVSRESGFFRPRLFVALLLSGVGLSLAMFSFAATPSAGLITPTSSPLTWTGTGTGVPPAANGEGDCTDIQGASANCDNYTLTISGTPSDWAGKQVHVQIVWGLPTTDYDLQIHKGSLAGPIVASSAAGGSTIEQVDLNPQSPSVGTGVFVAHIIYFAPNPQDQYKGSASVRATAAPPSPAPTPGVAVFAPRFENYNPPAAGPNTLGLRSGEPSIGVGAPITGHPDGRSMFQSDVQTLRVTFNGCTFPKSLWENKPAPTSQQDFDPILWTDPTTGRTIVHLLTFAGNVIVGESSYTDNDGDLWTPSTGAGIGSGVDHQTVGGGPYNPAALPPAPHPYPNAVYYCSQALVDASCARSDDGGVNYGASTITYTSECGGLHGHVQVGPDGVVYLPNKGCGGQQAAVVSENNGLTWNIRPVQGSSSGGSDPAVGVDKGGTTYFAYADADTKMAVTTSTNHGVNWNQPLDLGASFGLNNIAFPYVVPGDAGRAAVTFLGTPTTGGLQGNGFRGVWHLYVATTYDSGATWTTVDATPADAVQRGCIWEGGGANVCRNLLDFIGATMDKEGRILVGYADGCAGAECAQMGGPSSVGNAYTALAAIARQSGGKRLLAAFDAAPGTGASVPGTPSVSALRNLGVAKVAWSEADNGGSAITGYNIYRTISANTETLLASVSGSTLRYTDATATDPSKTYFYKVEAVNAQGVSCKENEVSVRYVGDSRTDPGFNVAEDPTGVTDGAPQAANPDLDIQTLSISEPSSGVNAGRIVFNLKMVNLATIPDQRMWRIVWADPRSPGQQYYVGMTKNGTITYEYGTVATATVGLVLGVPSTTPVGTPDFGSYDPGTGIITIAVSRDKIGSVQIGDVMGAFSVRTYNAVTSQIRSTNAIDTTTNANANDVTANSAAYAVVGPQPSLASVVSRKVHGSAGTFDIPLPLTGPVGIEDRTEVPAGTHHVVFTFPTNVTVSGATVTPGNGGTATASAPIVSGNQVTVNLTNVSNVQTLTVTLLGVNDGSGIGDVSAPMGILLGDTTADRSVNSADISQTKAQSGQVVTSSNFREDVTSDGAINSADISLVKSKSGTALP